MKDFFIPRYFLGRRLIDSSDFKVKQYSKSV